MVEGLGSRIIGFFTEQAGALHRLINRESEPDETDDCDIDYHDLIEGGLANELYFGDNMQSILTASRRAVINKQIQRRLTIPRVNQEIQNQGQDFWKGG